MHDRRAGIGGSDWWHLIGPPHRACALRLWREKVGEPPDNPPEHLPIFDRGLVLEPIILAWYARVTGAELLIHPSAEEVRVPGLPDWWVGSPDALIVDNVPVGALEAKTMGGWAWRRWRRGELPEHYVLQVQHYMALTGLPWADVAVLWPDGWELEWERVRRDDAVIQAMREAGEAFWSRVVSRTPPERPEPTQQRCGSCPWRPSCVGRDLYELARAEEPGLVERPDLEELVRAYEQARAAEAAAKAELDAAKAALQEAMGETQAALVGAARVYYRVVEPSPSLDARRLRQDKPRLWRALLSRWQKQRAPYRSRRVMGGVE